jgi:hypothetical protein
MAPTTQHSPDHSAILVRVETALDDLRAQHDEAFALPHDTDAESAGRALRMAAVCARKAAWWRLLAHRMPYAGNRVYYLAVLAATDEERDNARFWRDLASDWAARAANVPTSDAAGALSNWHELGVSA